MKFEFDTRTDTAKDAAALAAALAVLHGPAVAQAFDDTIESLENADPRAAEGYPTDGLTTVQQVTETSDQVVGTTATQEEVEGIDAFGIPWDARIHSSTKGMNKDGSWSRRRNTPDDVFDKVMAELMGNKPEVEPNAAEAFGNPTPSAAPAAPATDGSGETADTAGQTAPTAASPSSPVVPPPPPSTDPITFPKLMVKITKAQTAKTIDPAKVVEFLGMFGLSAVKELASAPAETIQAVNDLVDAHVGA